MDVFIIFPVIKGSHNKLVFTDFRLCHYEVLYNVQPL